MSTINGSGYIPLQDQGYGMPQSDLPEGLPKEQAPTQMENDGMNAMQKLTDFSNLIVPPTIAEEEEEEEE